MEQNNNEVVVVNPTYLIETTSDNTFIERAKAFKNFKEFIKNDFVDGVDFGQIPNVNMPSLFQAGGEKVQMYLGLTPFYKLLNSKNIENKKITDNVWSDKDHKYQTVENHRDYYSWEWACELWHGNTKVAEGVGMANTEEDKYVNQYKGKKTPHSLANTVMKIAKKRAFMDAIKSVAGISDMFTVDLEDNETIKSLKVDKTTKTGKATKDNLKTIFATAGAMNVTTEELQEILKEFGYETTKEIKGSDTNAICEKIKQFSANKK